MRKPISRAALAAHLVSLFKPVAGFGLVPDALTLRWWIPFALLSLFVGTTGSAMALLAHRRTSPMRIIVALTAQAVALLLFFADVYRATGLMNGATPVSRPSIADALYFSIVTWTTLGYGDFQPPAAYRLVAGAEALIGYVYLGWIVGLTTNLLRPERPE